MIASAAAVAPADRALVARPARTQRVLQRALRAATTRYEHVARLRGAS